MNHAIISVHFTVLINLCSLTCPVPAGDAQSRGGVQAAGQVEGIEDVLRAVSGREGEGAGEGTRRYPHDTGTTTDDQMNSAPPTYQIF